MSGKFHIMTLLISFLSGKRKVIGWTLLIILVQYVSNQSLAQNNELAFGNGETLEYTVSYHWGFIWADAGEIRFKATKLKDQRWHYLCTASSYQRYDWLFKVRDTFETISKTEPLLPSVYRGRTMEGSAESVSEYYFNEQHTSVLIKSRESGEVISKTLKINDQISDVLTATYKTRSLDWQQFTSGEGVILQMIMNNAFLQLPVYYMAKDTLKLTTGETFACLQFDANLPEGSIFMAGEAIRVWVSDDKNRLPVRIEAKIKVGSIDIQLVKYRHLAHPLHSLQNKK